MATGELGVVGCELGAAVSGLRVAECGLRVSDHGTRVIRQIRFQVSGVRCRAFAATKWLRPRWRLSARPLTAELASLMDWEVPSNPLCQKGEFRFQFEKEKSLKEIMGVVCSPELIEGSSAIPNVAAASRIQFNLSSGNAAFVYFQDNDNSMKFC